MGFEFNGISPKVQKQINAALEDGKISAEELKAMNLDPETRNSIMISLLKNKNFIGDGFDVVRDEKNHISFISSSVFDEMSKDIKLDESSLDIYRKYFNNESISKIKYKSGQILFLNSNGDVILDHSGNVLYVDVVKDEYKNDSIKTYGSDGEVISTRSSSKNNDKPIPYMGEIIDPDMKFSNDGEYILPENPADTPYAVANNILIAQYNKAYSELIENFRNTGWSAEFAEDVKRIFGSEATFASVKNELDKMCNQIKGLKKSLHAGEANYLEQFEKTFNVPFDEKNIAELVTANSKYNLVMNDIEMQKAFDSEFDYILKHEKPIEKFSITDNENGKTYEKAMDKDVIFQREFKKLAQFVEEISKGITKDENITGEEFLNQLFEYNNAVTTEEKYAIMHDFVKDYSKNVGEFCKDFKWW